MAQEFTFRCDYDANVWLPYAPEENEDLQDWAARRAELCWAESRVAPTPEQVSQTATELYAAIEPAAEWPGMLWVYYPVVSQPVGPLAWLGPEEFTAGSQQAIEAQAGVGDPDNLEPPVTSWLETNAGPAFRCWRLVKMPPVEPSLPPPVARLASYVWEVPAGEFNLALNLGSRDLAMMAQAEEHVDTLARAVHVVPL